MELSTYFRINESGTGQFERTLLIADESSYVSYLEGCTAPQRDENQLHAAVVELIALDKAEIKYSTVQNWYPGDDKGLEEYIILLLKEEYVVIVQKYLGLKLKRALQLLGNIPRVF